MKINRVLLIIFFGVLAFAAVEFFIYLSIKPKVGPRNTPTSQSKPQSDIILSPEEQKIDEYFKKNTLIAVRNNRNRSLLKSSISHVVDGYVSNLYYDVTQKDYRLIIANKGETETMLFIIQRADLSSVKKNVFSEKDGVLTPFELKNLKKGDHIAITTNVDLVHFPQMSITYVVKPQ